MLLKDNKALFIHIPKTGGTSAEGVFLRNMDPAPQGTVFGQKCLKENRHYHLDGRQHYGIQLFSHLKLSDYYLFSFVRNPYARFYSAYTFAKQKFDLEMSLEEYVDFATNQKHFYFAASIRDHLIPQHLYIQNTEIFNLIGALETFDENLKEICAALGFQYQHRHFFKSEYKTSSRYLEVLKPFEEKLTDFYAKDFEMFGYKKYDFKDLSSDILPIRSCNTSGSCVSPMGKLRRLRIKSAYIYRRYR